MTTRVRAPFPPQVIVRVRLFAYSLAGAVVLSFLPLPWCVVGFPFAVAAVVFGIASMIAMRHGSSMGLWTVVVVGFLMAGSFTLDYTLMTFLFRETLDYQDCLSRAITTTAKDRCMDEYEEAARVRLESWGFPVPWIEETES